MYYCGYSNCDLANGPGARVSLFTSGCSLNCKFCSNPESHDRYYGAEFDDEAKAQLLKDLGNSYIQGLSILGGDPLEPYNVDEVTALCKEIKEKYPSRISRSCNTLTSSSLIPTSPSSTTAGASIEEAPISGFGGRRRVNLTPTKPWRTITT